MLVQDSTNHLYQVLYNDECEVSSLVTSHPANEFHMYKLVILCKGGFHQGSATSVIFNYQATLILIKFIFYVKVFLFLAERELPICEI